MYKPLPKDLGGAKVELQLQGQSRLRPALSPGARPPCCGAHSRACSARRLYSYKTSDKTVLKASSNLVQSHYQLDSNRDERVCGGTTIFVMASVALMVKPQARPADATPWRHGWVIGDPNCRFNARSPLLRCAVWPQGPCESCSHHEPR